MTICYQCCRRRCKAAAQFKKQTRKIKWFQVKHTRSQFTAPIRKARSVRKAGTQQCDRIWYHVKKAIPKTLKSRSVNGYVNTKGIMSYVYAWMWCRDCKQSLYKSLGDLCGNVTQRSFAEAILEKWSKNAAKVEIIDFGR